MLLGLALLLHILCLIQVSDSSGLIEDTDFRQARSIKGLAKDRYYEYPVHGNNDENSFVTIKIFTKLKLKKVPSNPRKLWRNGTVPFLISQNCSGRLKKTLLEAIKRYENKTCIRFISRQNETTFIIIAPANRCIPVFRVKGYLKMRIDENCYRLDNILYEFMKVLDVSARRSKLDKMKTSKRLGNAHQRKTKISMRKAFSKVNLLYGCNKKALKLSRFRIHGRMFQLSDKTNGSRTKRNARIRRFKQDPLNYEHYVKITTTTESNVKTLCPETTTESKTTTTESSEIPIECNCEKAFDPEIPTESNFTTILTNGTTIGRKLTNLNPEQNHLIEIVSGINSRTVITDPSKLWSTPEIPYRISDDYDETQKRLIKEGMEDFRNKTCVRFIPLTNETTYILFVGPNTNRCSATIGTEQGKVNEVTLSGGCYAPGTILHELMHTMGFIHEQNRPDRDKFVIVDWDNINPDFKQNFEKVKEGDVRDYGVGYDYGSVMHYGPRDFAKDPKRPTITPRKSGVEIGQRKGFSDKDVFKINKLFNCSDSSFPGNETVKDEERNDPSVKEFTKKYLDFLNKLFKALYRALRTFRPNATEKVKKDIP